MQFALSAKCGIQPTISQFKIVQNFFERCHSKGHFPCSRMLYLFYHGNISAHRDIFQFIKILRRYSNFKLLNWLQSSACGYDLAHVVMI